MHELSLRVAIAITTSSELFKYQVQTINEHVMIIVLSYSTEGYNSYIIS